MAKVKHEELPGLQANTSAARVCALEALEKVNPNLYGQTRNHLDGAVTRLSPFLRHGVLSLAEVRDAVMKRAAEPSQCVKLIQELAWRDYYQRLWRHLGDRIWSDIEPYKTGYRAADYADELPSDLANGSTGIDYIDHFVDELVGTGYLHNHARMWLAAYIVHGRRIKWQAGARWFLSHLIDGDEASNNLSWQWCASTFSNKPYIYNRENVLKFSGSRFPHRCRQDPFDASYESLSQSLFRQAYETDEPRQRLDFRSNSKPETPKIASDPATSLVWIHDGMMSPSHPAIELGKSHLFVWDDEHISRMNFSARRIAFVRSALFCGDIHTSGRPIAQVLLDAATNARCTTIITEDTPDPRLLKTIDQLMNSVDVQVVPARPFVDLEREPDLTRFSRYWSKVERVLF